MTNLMYMLNMIMEKKHSLGCGIQCIAYVTERKPSEIRELATCNFPGHREIVSILKQLGHKIKTPFRSTIFEGRSYIATVPSLNIPGEFHAVVLWYENGVKVFDPVTSRKKKKYVHQNRNKLRPNEFKLLTWTSLIDVSC